MMKHRKLNLLTDKFFLLGLATLLLNDFVLKYEVGGWVTGKLSDICGLFIFPFFWSIFFGQQRLMIYILTVVMFIIWKLPVSTGILNAINEFAGTHFSRVIDYTDLFTLLIIPISYARFSYLNKLPLAPSQRIFLPAGLSLVSVLAFIATSMPMFLVKNYKPIDEKLICNMGKEEIFKNYVVTNNKFIDNLQDSSFRVTHTLSEHGGVEAVTWVKIYPLDSAHTVFFIDSLETYRYTGGLFRLEARRKEKEDKLRKISRKKLVDDFRKNVIAQIESRKKEPLIHVENPKRDTLRSGY